MHREIKRFAHRHTADEEPPFKSVSDSKVYTPSTHSSLLSPFTCQNAAQQSSLWRDPATAEAPCVWPELYPLGCQAADPNSPGRTTEVGVLEARGKRLKLTVCQHSWRYWGGGFPPTIRKQPPLPTTLQAAPRLKTPKAAWTVCESLLCSGKQLQILLLPWHLSPKVFSLLGFKRSLPVHFASLSWKKSACLSLISDLLYSLPVLMNKSSQQSYPIWKSRDQLGWAISNPQKISSVDKCGAT